MSKYADICSRKLQEICINTQSLSMHKYVRMRRYIHKCAALNLHEICIDIYY